MVRALAIAAIAWPLLMAASVGVRASGSQAIWTAVPFVVGEVICHRRPERSFHTAGVQWPVCGRCAGLYLAAPVGAVAAWLATRRRRQTTRTWMLLAIAAAPTAAAFAIEWSGLLPVTTVARFLTALPLGAAVAWIVVRAAGGDRPIG